MNIIGLAIGLYGYIFPGNINIMILDLYMSRKYRLLTGILLLIIIFESIYCLATLYLLTGLQQNSSLYRWTEICSFFLIIGMGIWMLLESRKNSETVQKNTLYRGIINVIIHPQQIPFWLVVGVVLNPLMKFGASGFLLAGFVLFNAAGTLVAMGIYMFLGTKILQYFKLNLTRINKLMGLLYLIIGIYGLFHFLLA